MIRTVRFLAVFLHFSAYGPVSYTHLDVYKRQDECGADILKMAVMPQGSLDLCPVLEDVYKRQVCASGESLLLGCSKEPEVTWLCRFLKAAGAHILGEGTDTLRIRGVRDVYKRQVLETSFWQTFVR